jgi:hypothetical protein
MNVDLFRDGFRTFADGFKTSADGFKTSADGFRTSQDSVCKYSGIVAGATIPVK